MPWFESREREAAWSEVVLQKGDDQQMNDGIGDKLRPLRCFCFFQALEGSPCAGIHYHYHSALWLETCHETPVLKGIYHPLSSMRIQLEDVVRK
jgi:hypothetical protein